MYKLLFILLAIWAIFSISCQQSSPSQVSTQTAVPTNTSEPMYRTISVQNISGTVELIIEGQDKPHYPKGGETISIGTVIHTGTDGRVVMELDDGTIVLITTNSSFRLTVLGGTVASPLTRFQTTQGEIFVFRLSGQTLPPGAGFEVETPNSIVAIRGSAMGVRYMDDNSGGVNSTTTLVCLTGTCIAEGKTGQAVELEGGQKVEITSGGTTGSIIPLTEEDVQRQMDALQFVQDSEEETLSVDVSYCNNEIGGETEIAANQEYIAITRPGCWATPEEAWAMRSTVTVSLNVDGVPASFIGYGPTAECLPGGVSTGTYNFGAYFAIGPFAPGDYTIETRSEYEGNEGANHTEVCILHAR